jgi:hypothetical protein
LRELALQLLDCASTTVVVRLRWLLLHELAQEGDVFARVERETIRLKIDSLELRLIG